MLNSKFYILNTKGFTLIELLVFLGIFTVIVISFLTVFTAVIKVQGRQTGISEVNRQSQFVLQTIQYYVERSSYVDMTTDVATNTIKLVMASSSLSPTYLYLSNDVFYLKETDSGAPQPLTTSKVRVTNATFVKRQNPGGKHSVDAFFTVEYATANPGQRFAQTLDTAVARVSAATFDSDVVPTTGNTFGLGIGAANWRSINSTIYFNGSNVGIGTQNANAPLQVSGGPIYVDTANSGIILRSTNGTCYIVTVQNNGTLNRTQMACP